MTDPNIPPPRDDRPDVVHHTTINNPSGDRGGSGWIGFLVGGLLVVLIIIGIVVYSGGGLNRVADTEVDLDVDLPAAPSLPAPDLPKLPPVEPPSVPDPTPAPAPAN